MNNYHLHTPIDASHALIAQYPELVAQLLLDRGIETLDQAEAFLNPKYDDNYDPFLLHDMEKSIARFCKAIQAKEKITIYADYDADGVPGSVVLANLLEKIGYKNFDIYIPHRHDEGYGIHIEALEKIVDSGTDLIITIDVGITAHGAANWCLKNGVDLIITDHHLPLKKNDGSQDIPASFTLINPKQETCHYPDPMLCGSGVIFKFVQAFIQKHGAEYSIPDGWEKWLLDMVGIATISDMVPLRNENRLFAYFGMQVVQAVCKGRGKRPGLKKLVWDAGINQAHMTEEDIAFSVTPKINAASRMSHPQDAVAVFTAQNDTEAQTSAKHLDSLNKERKKLTKKMTDEALIMLTETPPESLIVVGNPDWQAGILGLVASKLVNNYNMPAFVWSREGDLIKGSCRSCDGLHLVDIMQSADPEIFSHFGGHAEAGGFAVHPEQIENLEPALKKSLADFQEKNSDLEPDVVNIDMEMSLDAVTVDNYQSLRQLAPFGVGNPKPLFLFKDVLIDYAGAFGRDKNHLEIKMKNSFGKTIRGISFFKIPTDFEKLETGLVCDLIAHIEYSVFMGKHELRLKIVDIV